MIWVAVGGRGTLVGAILGAVLVNFGKTYFTGALPELWLFALGGLFIFVTLLLPKGRDGPVLAPQRRPRNSAITEAEVSAAARGGRDERPAAPTRCCISTASPSASTGSAR